MFKFLKDLKTIFSSDKELEVEEVELINLNNWFENKVSKIGFNEQAKSYFAGIKEIKEQLPELIKDLNEAEVSKDNKNVQDRVKNIVKGHKDNFSREIERFEENLELNKKGSFKTLQEYQEVVDYNKQLDKRIEELAKRTAKSYQAAQHLFFDPVEKLFKKTGELNTLIKEFEKTINNFHIEELISIKELIQKLNHDITKKEDFTIEIKEKEEQEKAIQSSLFIEEKEREKLKNSEEYKKHKEIEKNIGEIEKEIKSNDDNVFSYFSKLTKPLRKYERIAIDNKIIQDYINDGIRAFWQDSELKIKESLQGLKKSLKEDKIQVDEKQKNNFLELIEKSEKGYLEELKEIGDKLKAQREDLLKKIEEVEIIFKLEEVSKTINSENEKLSTLQKETLELKSKLEKVDLEKIKQEIIKNINQKFKIKLKIND